MCLREPAARAAVRVATARLNVAKRRLTLCDQRTFDAMRELVWRREAMDPYVYHTNMLDRIRFQHRLHKHKRLLKKQEEQLEKARLDEDMIGVMATVVQALKKVRRPLSEVASIREALDREVDAQNERNELLFGGDEDEDGDEQLTSEELLERLAKVESRVMDDVANAKGLATGWTGALDMQVPVSTQCVAVQGAMQEHSGQTVPAPSRHAGAAPKRKVRVAVVA
jgi:hypothetical protein